MKKIAITKNGKIVLKIIEMNNKDDMCDFKIVPCIQGDSLKIFSLKMFSLKQQYVFDPSKYIEISYHRYDGIHPTKIQVKIMDSETKELIKHEALPLTRLIDPYVNSYFPIPLLKITIPDNFDGEEYHSSNRYVEFNVGNNNIVELFMIRRDFNFQLFCDGFPNFFMMLLDDSFEFFTSSIFRGYNGDCAFQETGFTGDAKTMLTAANITDDIGLWCTTILDKNIHNSTLDLLFIENEFYVPVCVHRYTTMRGYKELMYLCDLDRNTFLSNDEKKRYLKFFEKENKKFLSFKKHHTREYDFIYNYYLRIDKGKDEIWI